MRQVVLCLFIFSSLLLSCQLELKKKLPEANQTEQDSIQVIEKPYRNSTKIEYEIPVFKGSTMKHGIQKRFYLAGSLYSAIPYDHGVKQGMAYTNYQASPDDQNPQVWKEQPYKDNLLNGVCKRFHRDGSLQAEYEYKNGLPAIGLKEYSQSGKLIKQPTLIITKNRVNDGFYIAAHLSDKSKKVNFYLGDLVEGKFLSNNPKSLQVRNGTGEVIVYKNSGTVTITAEYSTRYYNKGLVSKTIQL